MPAIDTITDGRDLDEWKLDFTATIEDPPICARALQDFKRRLSQKFRGLNESFGDRHLLRYLRYKNYDSEAAFKMIDNINEYRIKYPDRYFPGGKGPRDYEYVYKLQSFQLLHHRNPFDGSCVISISKGDWTPETGVDFVQSVNAGILLVDCILKDERVQRDGATLIIDCKGLKMSWLLQFLPLSQIHGTVAYSQDGCPLRFESVHIVNQPLLFTLLYNVVRPFLSKENQQKIHIHGTHVEKLHEYVDRRILPRHLLGLQDPDFAWLPEFAYKHHDEVASRTVIPFSTM